VADVNSNIGINFDTRAALASLRKLQAGLSTFNQSLTQGNVAAMNAQKGLNERLMQSINATGKFVASQKEIATSTASFTSALEKNQLSMRQYFRYTAAAATANTKVFKGMFAQEREVINRARKDRVKLLQSQYIQLGNANGDLVKVLQVVPKHLQMTNGKYTDYATRVQMAAQRQQFLNQLLKQGSTNLLNFGKNTQWAGRQLMVGLTIPLSILGSAAAKTFLEMEAAVLKFTRVYGDITTSGDATNKAVANIQRLGREFTKYGIAVKDTMEMAATAAAMGMQGNALEAQVIQATRLSVLGQVEQQQALETTISLQNAFGISSEQLASKINFLNAVENQTVLSIEDLTIAIPKAGPVVKQLGGSVEDLAFFMTAMKEGGINASEGANALKSGLASIINPAKKTSEFLAEMGINIKGIVDNNAGNLKGTVVGLARALDTLDPLNRSRAIEQLFGKFQFARISTLFQNIVKDGTQASRALDLAGASLEELAILSERELKRVEDSTGAKFKKAMENLKNELVPVGKAFLEAITPIVGFVGKLLEKFNGLSDGTKKAVTIMIAVLGAIAPVALMTFGILANGLANIIKFFAMLRGGIAKLNGQNNILGGGFDYLTNQQTELLAETNALHTSHQQLIGTFNIEKSAVDALALAYQNAGTQARNLAASSPGLFNTVPGPAGAVAGIPPVKFATGGVVPGTGNGDTVPALLTPGEVVITKQTAKENPELLAALQNGSVIKYAKGTGKSPFSSDIIAKLFEQLGLNSQTDRLRMPVGVLEKRYSAAGNLAPKEVNHGRNAAGEIGQDPDYLQSEFGRDAMDENIRVPLEKAGASAERASEVLVKLESTLDEMVLTYDGTTSSWQTASDKALKAIEERTDLTNKEKEIIRQRLAPKKSEDFIIPSNPVVDVKPSRDGKPAEATMRDERSKEAYYDAEQKKRLKSKYPELSDDIDSMEFSHYPGTESMYGGRSSVESPVVNRTTVGPDGKTSKQRLPLSEEQLAIIAKKRAEVEAYRIPKQEAELISSAPKVEVTEEDKAKAASEGAKVGAAAAEGLRSNEGTAAASPSKKGIKAGKEVAEGLADGMQQGEAEVRSQSSRLGNAAVPTAAETQARVGKMDLGNKAFYDDINTPEMRDERQVLKSLDRQRRKRGSKGSVELPADKASSKSRVSLAKKTQVQSKEIAKETENIANSTVLVAEETDEFANVTQAAVDAQTTNTSNLITTNQLTNAANNNLGEMLPAMDQAGSAQQDLAKSSANIANTNEQIEAEKRKELERLKAYNAQEAARQAAENGIIPPGSQSIDNRMGSIEAYEEASTYTRDKKGQILFDPELDANGKKQPTTLSEKQIAQKKRGMRREKVGKVSGKVSGAAGSAAMIAGMAGAPPQVVAGLGAVATVAQFAPMLAGLTGPQGIVVALLALGAGAFLLNKKLQATAEAIAKFTRSTTVGADMLKKIGEQTGKVGASELMNKKRSEGQLQTYNEANRDSTLEAEQFLSGDAGKALQAAFVSNATKNGTEVAAQQFALQIAAAISDGTIAPELGQKIAYQMGINLKDSVAATRINVQLRQLIGPNGEDLGKDPLEIRARISQQASSLSEKLVNQYQSKDRSEVGGNSKLSMFGTLGLIGAASGSDKTAALAVAGSSAIETAQAQADAMSLYYDEQLKTLRNELVATTNKEKQLEIQKKINGMILQQSAGMSRINNMVAAQISRQTSNAQELIGQNKSGLFTGNHFLNDAARRQDAFFDAQKADVKAKYKGTAQEASAQRVLNLGNNADEDKSFANKTEGRTFEAKINFLMQSGQMQPEQLETMMKMFSGDLKKMDTILAVGMRIHGGPKMGELASSLMGIDKKVSKRIMVQMARKNPEEFEKIGNVITLLQASDGLEVDMEAVIKTIGMPGLEKLAKELDLIEKLPDPIELEAITKFSEENPDMDLQGVIDNWEYYSKLDPEVRKEAIQTYRTLFETATNFKTIEERNAWANIQAKNAALLAGDEGSEAYNTTYKTTFEALTLINGKPATLEQMQIIGNEFAQEGTEAKYRTKSTIDSKSAGNGSTGGDKKNPLDFLDNLAMRIKNVRDGAFDATKPLASMLAAFSNPKIKKDMDKAFKAFDGLQQRMIDMKVPKEFRDMIMGMSAEDFNEIAKLTGKRAIFKFKKGKPRTKANIEGLTDTGKKTMKTYNEAIVGEANVVNREAVEQVANQEKAFRILVASGATATEALEQVQDAATAAAIAAGALGKKGSTERKQYIEDLKKATDETERFALKQKMIQANEEFKLLEQMPKLGTAMKMAGFSADQMSEVLNDPALAKHLIEDLKDGKVDAKEIADYLNSIEARKIIDIQVNFNSGKFSDSAKPGMDIVDEMFAVQEEMLRTGADPRTTGMVQQMNANNKEIQESEIAAKGFRRQIDLINREIRDIEQGIEKNYTRPIEDAQERISDYQRTLEIDPEFGDRAMEEINKQNAKMSNDSAIMSNQAEKINEEYDKQAEALAKVAEVNEEILNQQKSQLDIAGALTSGDISAAAKAAQDARAQSAQRFGGSVADALQQSRENEIKGLRGAETGLSQEQIDQKQFDNAQKLYAMETDIRRVDILNKIRLEEDEIYRLEELREGELLKIRDKEDEILRIQKEQLQPLEDKIADLTFANELIQAQIDKLVSELTVLDKTKAEWDAIKAKIAANALASKDLNKDLGALLASVGEIEKKWQSILALLKEYNSTPVAVKNAQAATTAAAAAAASQVRLDKIQSGGSYTDADVLEFSDLASANAEYFEGVFEAVSDGTANGSQVIDYVNAVNEMRGTPNGLVALSSGGLVPKRYSAGAFSIGTDTVPAMLTPGEFVMSKYAVDTHGINTMKSINNGQSVGGTVYNNTYELTVNARTDANPNEIAQAVMSTIKNVEGRRIRGVSLNGR
jgi:TP901 family phage tail tape measure protein